MGVRRSDVFLHWIVAQKQQACVRGSKHAAVNFSSCVPFFHQKGGRVTFQLLYLSRSLSRSLSLSLLWLRTGDCPLAMEWWEMGGDALAGLEEEVVEEELLVERSKPPPPPPLPVLLLLCLMPLSSMPWPPPPVTSFHNCWSSAGLRPARETKGKREKTGKQRQRGERGKQEKGQLRLMYTHYTAQLNANPSIRSETKTEALTLQAPTARRFI